MRLVASVGWAVSTSSSDNCRAARSSSSSSTPARCETPHGIGQRLAWHAALVLVLAAAPETVVLLGEIDELEVHAERPQDERLALRIEARDRPSQPLALRGAAGCTRGAGEVPYLLLEVEQGLPFLLDEDATEDRSEEANVASERCVCRSEVLRQSVTPSRSRSRSASGSTRIGRTRSATG